MIKFMRRHMIISSTVALLVVAAVAIVLVIKLQPPNKYDVEACQGVKRTVAAIPGGNKNDLEISLMEWQAIAHSPMLKSQIQSLEESLTLAGPGDYSQLGYTTEAANIVAIGQTCNGMGVSGIANGWQSGD